MFSQNMDFEEFREIINSLEVKSKEDPDKLKVYKREERFWDIKPIRRYVDRLDLFGIFSLKPHEQKRDARQRDLTDLLLEEIEFSLKKNQTVIGRFFGSMGEGKSTVAKVITTYDKLFWDANRENKCRVYITWSPAETRRTYRKLKNGDKIIQDEWNRQTGKGSRGVYSDIANLIETTRKVQNSFYVCSPTDREMVQSFVIEPFGLNWENDPPLIRCYLYEPFLLRIIGVIYLPIIIHPEIERGYTQSKDKYIELIKSTGGAETAFVDEERALEDISYLLSILKGHESRTLIEAKATNLIIGDLNYREYVINHVWEQLLDGREQQKLKKQKIARKQKEVFQIQQLELLEQILPEAANELDLGHPKLKNSAIRAWFKNRGLSDQFHNEALQRLALTHYYITKDKEAQAKEEFTFSGSNNWIENMKGYIKSEAPSWKNGNIDIDRAERLSKLYEYFVNGDPATLAFDVLGRREGYGVGIRQCQNDMRSLAEFVRHKDIAHDLGIKFEKFFIQRLEQAGFPILSKDETGYSRGIDCLTKDPKSGDLLVISLKFSHQTKDTLDTDSFSHEEWEFTKKTDCWLIGVLWNPIWKAYLCKYLDYSEKERITWSKQNIGSSDDLHIKKLLKID